MADSPTADARITLPCPRCHRMNRVRADRVQSGPKCGHCASALELGRPALLDDASFDAAVNGTDLPVFVDFYADWCGPCKMMAPSVDALAHERAGTALVAKVDTEAATQTAERFRITGIPTSIVFRNGQEVKRQSGAMPLGALRAMLD